MIKRPLILIAACGLVLGLSGCGSADEAEQGSSFKPADPLAGLEITTAKAESVTDVPLETVPAQVTLPPEARVAVTASFPGAAVRVFVIEGQSVVKGQPLALVRAAEPLRIRGDLSRAQAEMGLAQARAARLSRLADEGIISRARADEAQAALGQARASVAQQSQLGALAGTGPDGNMVLRAPIAGRVSHVAIETGGPVDGLTAPFVIEASGAYQLDLQIPERVARDVSPGMTVRARLDDGQGEGSTVTGQIIAIAPSIDSMTRSVMAKARIEAAPGIVAGRNLRVEISGSQTASGVAVPASAVVRIGDADHVFVRNGKSFEPRKVVVRVNTGERSVISSGLKPGEVVATSSVAELKALAAE